MNRVIILLLSVVSFFSMADAMQAKPRKAFAASDPEISALIGSLDSVLANSGKIARQKEATIDKMRGRLKGVADRERRYWLYKDIYDEYSSYNSDSALHYTGLMLDIANSLDRDDWRNNAYLNYTYLYSATGLLSEAQKALENINPEKLDPSMHVQYQEMKLFLLMHREQYVRGERNEPENVILESNNMLNSLTDTLSEENPRYLWFLGMRNSDSGEKARKVIPYFEKELEGRSFDTRQDAMDAWITSRLFEAAGDRKGKVKYLILSAIADVRACNREVASLEELATLLFEEGDLSRANLYMDKCLEWANDYRSRVRLARLSSERERMFKALARQNERQMQHIKVYIIGFILLTAVLLLSLFLLFRQMGKLKKSRAELNKAKIDLEERFGELQSARASLNEINAQLSQANTTLRENAAELAAVNEDKEKCIADIFAICSGYINKLDDFRKNVYRMLVAKRFQDVMDLTKTPELSNSEIKELYANFDSIFLHIYPDFIKDFNSLLRPGEQVSPRKGELMTTELRIYALVRLGVNDSVKIARFLHCSPQTVYNTRLRTRNKAVVPREEFAEAVMNLGKKKL